jgi:predicted RNase H-like nuclease (RuvC/YqgF family)
LTKEVEDLNKRNYLVGLDCNKQIGSFQDQNNHLKRKVQEMIEENHKLMKKITEEGSNSVAKSVDFRFGGNLDEDQELRLLELESIL